MMSGRRLYALCFAVAMLAPLLGGRSTAMAALTDPNTSVADPNASVAYQHDPAHDGRSLDTSFVAPFTQAWSTKLGGTVGYPLIADGRVFVTVAHASGYGNDVVALSLATDFKNYSEFAPAEYHVAEVQTVLDQVVEWSGALAHLRRPAAA